MKPIPFDQIPEEAIANLQTTKPNGMSWYSVNHPNSVVYNRITYKSVTGPAYKKSAPCYAPLRSYHPNKCEFLGVGYYTQDNDEAGVAYFNWVTSREVSPWRFLLKDDIFVVRSTDNDGIRGFFLGPKTLEGVEDINFAMNFLIATRAFNEFEPHIRYWHKAVQAGVSPERALAYCSHFGMFKGEIKKINHVSNSNHWPLDGDPDFKNLKAATPRKTGLTNDVFCGDDTGVLKAIGEAESLDPKELDEKVLKLIKA